MPIIITESSCKQHRNLAQDSVDAVAVTAHYQLVNAAPAQQSQDQRAAWGNLQPGTVRRQGVCQVLQMT